eukprot:CAMPEP_0204348584 /NCGR_PEP_ID=MMETSP0469-20131031/28839_1 /ASSEMBLY_ACC=CAM_ASM_000384 /TAXON_ID=2969 /ORGANISM="Oxyrrhis marina" /LENGTH=719 /DNA_ID=CAMNT_0051334595 /DNA_START=25 /DNA_END=2181 /DNA_ORIENTATION=-
MSTEPVPDTPVAEAPAATGETPTPAEAPAATGETPTPAEAPAATGEATAPAEAAAPDADIAEEAAAEAPAAAQANPQAFGMEFVTAPEGSFAPAYGEKPRDNMAFLVPGDEELFLGGGALNGAVGKLLLEKAGQPIAFSRVEDKYVMVKDEVTGAEVAEFKKEDCPYARLQNRIFGFARRKPNSFIVATPQDLEGTPVKFCIARAANKWEMPFGSVFLSIFKEDMRPYGEAGNTGVLYTVGPLGANRKAEGEGEVEEGRSRLVVEDPQRFVDQVYCIGESVIQTVAMYNGKHAQKEGLPKVECVRLPVVAGGTFIHPKVKPEEVALSLLWGVHFALREMPEAHRPRIELMPGKAMEAAFKLYSSGASPADWASPAGDSVHNLFYRVEHRVLPGAKVFVPGNKVHKILGHGGERIARLERESGARVSISKDENGEGERCVKISGSDVGIEQCKKEIHTLVTSPDWTGNLAGTEFSDPDQLKQLLNDLQTKREGEELTGHDLLFAFHLLCYHPEFLAKMIRPVKGLIYKTTKDNPEKKCFHFIFTDGSEEEISGMRAETRVIDIQKRKATSEAPRMEIQDGCVVDIIGIPVTTTQYDLRDALSQYGEVKFVDIAREQRAPGFSADEAKTLTADFMEEGEKEAEAAAPAEAAVPTTKATVRLGSKEVADMILEDLKEINDAPVEVKLLTGDAQQEYWDRLNEIIAQKFHKGEGKGKGKGKGK